MFFLRIKNVPHWDTSHIFQYGEVRGVNMVVDPQVYYNAVTNSIISHLPAKAYENVSLTAKKVYDLQRVLFSTTVVTPL